MGKLKTLLKNTCEGVHLLADFKLFIVIFVGIISWKGVHVSMGEIRGGGVGGGGGGIGGHFDWGVFEKNSKMGGSSPPLWETLPLHFCWHQHFVTANLQFLLYQKIQI